MNKKIFLGLLLVTNMYNLVAGALSPHVVHLHMTGSSAPAATAPAAIKPFLWQKYPRSFFAALGATSYLVRTLGNSFDDLEVTPTSPMGFVASAGLGAAAMGLSYQGWRDIESMWEGIKRGCNLVQHGYTNTIGRVISFKHLATGSLGLYVMYKIQQSDSLPSVGEVVEKIKDWAADTAQENIEDSVETLQDTITSQANKIAQLQSVAETLTKRLEDYKDIAKRAIEGLIAKNTSIEHSTSDLYTEMVDRGTKFVTGTFNRGLQGAQELLNSGVDNVKESLANGPLCKP